MWYTWHSVKSVINMVLDLVSNGNQDNEIIAVI